MAKIYAEFGIEIFDNTIVDNCLKTISILGELRTFETKRKTVIINYDTPTQNIVDLENLSDYICDVIEPHKNEITSLLAKSKDKLYASICFVKISYGNNDVALKINKRLLSLANTLDIEIDFDGF